MTLKIPHNVPSVALQSEIKKAFEPSSFLRSVLDSICKFFTGHPTETTIEKCKVKQAINQAIINTLSQDIQYNCLLPEGARTSVSIVIEKQTITIEDDPRGGVNLQCTAGPEKIFIPTEIKVRDLINQAIILNGGGDIDTTSVSKKIGVLDLDSLEKASLERYQKNGFFRMTPSEDSDLFGSINGNIHLYQAITLDNKNAVELPCVLNEMREKAVTMKGDSEQEHISLRVLGIHNLQTKLPLDSDHYVLAAVSSNPSFSPIIVDSKNFAVYPDDITVLRSGLQKATDTVSCGSHSLRAMNHFAIQLSSGKAFTELMPPPAFNREICSTAIHVDKFVAEQDEKYRRELSRFEQTLKPDDVWIMGDDFEENE